LTALEFDLVLGGTPRFAAEAPWARRIVERYARLLPYRVKTDARGRRVTVADAAGDSPIVLVQLDPEAYLLPDAARRLVSACVGGATAVALPVSNEPWCEEARAAPPFAYHTPALLEEAVRYFSALAPSLREAAAPRSAVYAARRRVLQKLPPALPLEDVPGAAAGIGETVSIDPGAYLHRYGEMDGQSREDLVAKIPPGARAVLDVGCSRGQTAIALREAGVERVVGIEPDPGDAAEAAKLCDRVLPSRLEEIAEEFPGEFDAILFGDVLEHLLDPSEALARVRPWLSERGVVVASVPNLGHWSVVADLLEGRFDYVPYSILSGTHVRFFTRRTVEELFEACGYRVESIDTVTFGLSPEGSRKLAFLSALPGASPDLTAAEFLAVARLSSPR
jgi:2-polyprenyl-3-methyl-5-hydroxy-6-metoxy-1,4-benzoquinol methylase